MTEATVLSDEGTVSAMAHWTDKAEAWTDQADLVAKTADRFNTLLLDAADITTGQTVLDLASGAGEPALSEARAVGPEGRVVATDLVLPMLSGIQRRDKEGVLSLTACDMQALPFASQSFDRVTSRFGIMFPPDPFKALQEALRVLKPHGKAAYLVWGPLEEQTMFPILFDAVEEVLGRPPNDQHKAIFRFGPLDSLAAPCRMAGFRDVSIETHRLTSIAPVGKPFWRATLIMTFGGQLAGLEAGQRAAIDAAIEQRLEPNREADGYRLDSLVRVVTGVA